MRSVAIRFAIAIRHENPEIDRLIDENDRYATVDKFFGFGQHRQGDESPSVITLPINTALVYCGGVAGDGDPRVAAAYALVSSWIALVTSRI